MSLSLECFFYFFGRQKVLVQQRQINTPKTHFSVQIVKRFLYFKMLPVIRQNISRHVGRRWSSGFSFGLSDDQKAFQELARNFAKTEMIPVGEFRSRAGLSAPYLLKLSEYCDILFAAAHYDQTMDYPMPIFKRVRYG